MSPDQPIDVALGEPASAHLRRLRKRLRKARDGDAEGIHDARTTLRRARVDLEVMGRTVFARGRSGTLARRLRSIEKALSDARDTDILLGELHGYADADGVRKEGLAELEDRLQRRRRRSVRRARRSIERGRTAVRATEKLAKVRSEVPRATTPVTRPRRAEHFTRETLWWAYDQVLAHDQASGTDVEALHDFRSACRQLRYAVELFDGVIEAGVVLNELRAVQDELGEMHDRHVAAQLVRKWMANGKVSSSPELVGFVAACERRRDVLLDLCVERRASVLSAGFRRRLAEALDGPSRNELPAALEADDASLIAPEGPLPT